MSDDGWDHVAYLLQKCSSNVKPNNNKRKLDTLNNVNIFPELPEWMKASVFKNNNNNNNDNNEGHEYIEFNMEYFTSHLKTKRRLQDNERIENIIEMKEGISSLGDVQTEQKTNQVDTEVLNNIKVVLEKLQNQNPPYNLPSNLNYLFETNNLPEALSYLKLQSLKDELLNEIVYYFVTLNTSYIHCSAFAQYCLFPKVIKLETTASRSLVAGFIHCIKLHPGPFLVNLLIPLITDPTSGTVQCELVSRIVFVEKCLPPASCLEFLKEVLSKKQEWTEHFIQLITNALNIPQLTDEIGLLIASQVNRQADSFTNSSKFAKFIFTFISKHPSIAKSHSVLLQQTLSKSKNFLAKSAISQLEKL